MDTKYWAFISYSHKDETLCGKLHKRLEGLKIPKNDNDIKKIYPVFRDQEELPTSSSLGTNLENALNNSKYLIVICTENSACSNWVDEEVKTFIRLGREDKIIALSINKSAQNIISVLTPELIKLYERKKLNNVIYIEKHGLKKSVNYIASDILNIKRIKMSRYQRWRCIKKSLIWTCIIILLLITPIVLFSLFPLIKILISDNSTSSTYEQQVNQENQENLQSLTKIPSVSKQQANKVITKTFSTIADQLFSKAELEADNIIKKAALKNSKISKVKITRVLNNLDEAKQFAEMSDDVEKVKVLDKKILALEAIQESNYPSKKSGFKNPFHD